MLIGVAAPISTYHKSFLGGIWGTLFCKKRVPQFFSRASPSHDLGHGQGFSESTVCDFYDSVAIFGIKSAVGHHDNRLSVRIEPFKQIHDFRGVSGIQVPGGFVRIEYRRLIYHGASDSNSLLLTAGELIGKSVSLVFQTHFFQRR